MAVSAAVAEWSSMAEVWLTATGADGSPPEGKPSPTAAQPPSRLLPWREGDHREPVGKAETWFAETQPPCHKA